MIRKYVNVEVDTEAEVEIWLEDVLEYIQSASPRDLETIRLQVGVENQEAFQIDNLYDREKFLILRKAMEKYNLDQLIEKLGITQADAM